MLYDKSETASPTVSTDALMLSIIVDAHEGRDVATADMTGAYLKADMDDFVVMKFMDDSVDILCEMNPLHKRFIAVEKYEGALCPVSESDLRMCKIGSALVRSV